MSDRYGCTDGGCVFQPPSGMHTNGGCKCLRLRGLPLHERQEVARKVAAMRADMEAVRRDLDAVQEERRWIPVGERLPDGCMPVLIYRPNLGAWVDYFVRGHWDKHAVDEVTHWMPLPEPPEVSDG